MFVPLEEIERSKLNRILSYNRIPKQDSKTRSQNKILLSRILTGMCKEGIGTQFWRRLHTFSGSAQEGRNEYIFSEGIEYEYCCGLAYYSSLRTAAGFP